MRQIAQQQSISASVLKYRFYFYLDILRPTDQEMIAIEQIVCYSVSPRGKKMPHLTGLCPPPDQSGGRGKKQELWAIFFIVISLRKNS